MVNINKIVKYNLESEVLKLKDSGYSMLNIANMVSAQHPDIKELSNLSAMSIQRFLESYNKEQAKDKVRDGEDIDEHLREEFREKMYEIDDETHEIFKIMKKSLLRIVKTGDDYQVIKSAKDVLTAIEQSKRNWNSLIQWGIDTSRFNNEAKREINFIEVNNLILNWSKELCPKCRSKVIGYVTAEEEKEGD